MGGQNSEWKLFRGVIHMADDSQQGPELIAAVVGPIGTHRELIISAFIDAFSRVNYKCGEPIRLTDLFQEIPKEPWNRLQPNAPDCS